MAPFVRRNAEIGNTEADFRGSLADGKIEKSYLRDEGTFSQPGSGMSRFPGDNLF
jgi:hypothetical protein